MDRDKLKEFISYINHSPHSFIERFCGVELTSWQKAYIKSLGALSDHKINHEAYIRCITKGEYKMNKLFLISGHSGSGKTSIMKSLMSNEIVSFTTREKRQGEVDGQDYKFITLDKFHSMKESNKLIEWVEYSGNFYGIDLDEYENKIDKGHAFCIVDRHGMEQLKEIHSDCVTIFLYTPYEQAYKQMKKRGDSEESIKNRLKTYNEEIKNKEYYDYVIRNNSGMFNKTKEIIKNIIESEIDS